MQVPWCIVAYFILLADLDKPFLAVAELRQRRLAHCANPIVFCLSNMTETRMGRSQTSVAQ